MDFNKIRHIESRHGVSLRQGEVLFQLAKHAQGLIVEIGSYMGRSTVYLAAGSLAGGKNPVYAIDPWDNEPGMKRQGVLEKFWDNVKKAGVDSVVNPIMNYSHVVFDAHRSLGIFEPGVELLFIDGAHDYDNVKADTAWIQIVNQGGRVVFHDYDSGNGKLDGVTRAVDEFRERGELREIAREGSLIVFEKQRKEAIK